MSTDAYDYDADDVYDDRKPQRGSTIGVLALVFGVLGLVFFPFAVVALILGIIGLSSSARGMAIAGIVCGSLGVLFIPCY